MMDKIMKLIESPTELDVILGLLLFENKIKGSEFLQRRDKRVFRTRMKINPYGAIVRDNYILMVVWFEIELIPVANLILYEQIKKHILNFYRKETFIYDG